MWPMGFLFKFCLRSQRVDIDITNRPKQHSNIYGNDIICKNIFKALHKIANKTGIQNVSLNHLYCTSRFHSDSRRGERNG